MSEYAVIQAGDAVRIEPVTNPFRRGVTLREAFRRARQLAGWAPEEREGGEICRRCGGAGCGLCDGEGHTLNRADDEEDLV